MDGIAASCARLGGYSVSCELVSRLRALDRGSVLASLGWVRGESLVCVPSGHRIRQRRRHGAKRGDHIKARRRGSREIFEPPKNEWATKAAHVADRVYERKASCCSDPRQELGG